MEFKMLWLYDDISSCHGDRGNILSIKYRCEKRDIKFVLDRMSIGKNEDMSGYDLIYMGSGANTHVKKISEDLQSKKSHIESAVKSKKMLLLIGTSFSLFGKSYKNEEESYQTLGLFDYDTTIDKERRCVGNIKITANLDGELEIIGFENHSTQITNIKSPLGRVDVGNGNIYEGEIEGYLDDNIIATNIIGPLLPRNAKLTDYIISKVMSKKYDGLKLKNLDDKIEQKAYEQWEKIL